MECRQVSAGKQKGWHLHHSPDAWHHRIKYCYWISLQRSAHEKLYQLNLSPYSPSVLLQMLVPTSSPRICVCWLIWWSTCCSSMRSCCSRSADGNCFPWPATSDMDSLSLWDWKSKNKEISRKIFTQLAQKRIDKTKFRKRQRKNKAILPVIETSLRRYILMRRIWRASPATMGSIRTVVYHATERKPCCITTKSPCQWFSQHRTTQRRRRRKASPLITRSLTFLMIKWTQKCSVWLVSHA